jgi:hypothetical protein
VTTTCSGQASAGVVSSEVGIGARVGSAGTNLLRRVRLPVSFRDGVKMILGMSFAPVIVA